MRMVSKKKIMSLIKNYSRGPLKNLRATNSHYPVLKKHNKKGVVFNTAYTHEIVSLGGTDIRRNMVLRHFQILF